MGKKSSSSRDSERKNQQVEATATRGVGDVVVTVGREEGRQHGVQRRAAAGGAGKVRSSNEIGERRRLGAAGD